MVDYASISVSVSRSATSKVTFIDAVIRRDNIHVVTNPDVG
jgi:hypothetical protein